MIEMWFDSGFATAIKPDNSKPLPLPPPVQVRARTLHRVLSSNHHNNNRS